jgi:hypothetical protein
VVVHGSITDMGGKSLRGAERQKAVAATVESWGGHGSRGVGVTGEDSGGCGKRGGRARQNGRTLDYEMKRAHCER